MWRKCAILVAVCLIGPLAPLAIKAEEPSDPWKLSASGSLAAAEGNSEALSWSLQLLAEYDGELYQGRIGLDHFYAESNSVESSNSYKLHEQWSRELDEDWYLSQYAAALKDEVADIDYRIDASFLLGRHLLKGERANLSVELGPGYAWEEKAGNSDHYMTLRLGQRFEYHFNDHIRLWQSFGWTPRVEDLTQGIYELELGLENQLNGRLSLRTFVRHRVDSEPATGNGRGDTALMVGLNYSFDEGEDEDPSLGPDLKPLWLENAFGAGEENWSTTAAVGLTFNRGNADKTGLKLDWDTGLDREDLEFDWEVGYVFAEDGNRTSADRLSSRIQLNRITESPNYTGFAMAFLRDDLADIHYRITPSVLIGRNLIKNSRTHLVLEAGPAYNLEQTGRGEDQSVLLLLAERLEHQFNDRMKLDQSVELSSAFDDPEDYTLTTKVALDTKLNGSLSWRWELESRYENLPVSGRDHHDLLFSSGVVVSF